MKKMLFGLLGLVMVAQAFAATVNPTSNVLGDTAATASTLVYRDANGVFSAASLEDATVVTAKIGTAAVTTAKMYLDLTTSKVACVTSAARLGVCSTQPDTGGGCTCS